MESKDPRLLAKAPIKASVARKHALKQEALMNAAALADGAISLIQEDVKPSKVQRMASTSSAALAGNQFKIPKQPVSSVVVAGRYYASNFLSISQRSSSPLIYLSKAVELCKNKQYDEAYKTVLQFFTTDICVITSRVYFEAAKLICIILKEGALQKEELIDIGFECLQYMVCNTNSNLELWSELKVLFELPLENRNLFSTDYDIHLMKLVDSAIAQNSFDTSCNVYIFKMLQGNLNSGVRERRSSAFRTLVRLIGNDGVNATPTLFLKNYLRDMARHYDGVMREISIKLLEQFAKLNVISVDFYPIIKDLCCDSSVETRRIALRVLLKVATKYPEEKVKSHKNFDVRLTDEAFAIVCNAFNDSDRLVRTEAATVIGEFRNVSMNYLLQTLDKKLISEMINSNDNNEKTSIFINQWSLGNSLADDMPIESNTEEGRAWITSQACGAFVTALEDEFMTVRKGAVKSLGILAKDHPRIAALALDHLADMFNDEIDQVRLDAISALTPLLVHGKISKDQLITICTVLDDAMPDSRLALHELLCKANLQNSRCLLLLYQRLQQSLTRFPQDKNSIYKCCAYLGRRHADFVQGIIYKILDIHPIFDLVERTLQDAAHVSTIIMVFNATMECDVLANLLPEYMKRQYKTLNFSMPEIVPHIRAFESEAQSNYTTEIGKVIPMWVKEFFNAMFIEIHTLIELPNTAEATNMFDEFLIQFKKAMDFDEGISANIRYWYKLTKIVRDFKFFVLIPDTEHPSTVETLGNDLIHNIRDIEISFTNQHQEPHLLGIEIAFITHCLISIRSGSQKINVIFGELKQFHDKMVTMIESLKGLKSKGMKKICNDLVRCHERWDVHEDVEEEGAFVEIRSDEGTLIEILNILKSYNLNVSMECLSYGETMRIRTAHIEEPSKQSEEAQRAYEKMTKTINFVTLLKNFNEKDLDHYCVRLNYPNDSTALIKPLSNEFHKVDESTTRVRTRLNILFDESWYDVANITIQNGYLVTHENEISNEGEIVISNAGLFMPLHDSHKREKLIFLLRVEGEEDVESTTLKPLEIDFSNADNLPDKSRLLFYDYLFKGETFVYEEKSGLKKGIRGGSIEAYYKLNIIHHDLNGHMLLQLSLGECLVGDCNAEDVPDIFLDVIQGYNHLVGYYVKLKEGQRLKWSFLNGISSILANPAKAGEGEVQVVTIPQGVCRYEWKRPEDKRFTRSLGNCNIAGERNSTLFNGFNMNYNQEIIYHQNKKYDGDMVVIKGKENYDIKSPFHSDFRFKVESSVHIEIENRTKKFMDRLCDKRHTPGECAEQTFGATFIGGTWKEIKAKFDGEKGMKEEIKFNEFIDMYRDELVEHHKSDLFGLLVSAGVSASFDEFKAAFMEPKNDRILRSIVDIVAAVGDQIALKVAREVIGIGSVDLLNRFIESFAFTTRLSDQVLKDVQSWIDELEDGDLQRRLYRTLGLLLRRKCDFSVSSKNACEKGKDVVVNKYIETVKAFRCKKRALKTLSPLKNVESVIEFSKTFICTKKHALTIEILALQILKDIPEKSWTSDISDKLVRVFRNTCPQKQSIESRTLAADILLGKVTENQNIGTHFLRTEQVLTKDIENWNYFYSSVSDSRNFDEDNHEFWVKIRNFKVFKENYGKRSVNGFSGKRTDKLSIWQNVKINLEDKDLFENDGSHALSQTKLTAKLNRKAREFTILDFSLDGKLTFVDLDLPKEKFMERTSMLKFYKSTQYLLSGFNIHNEFSFFTNVRSFIHGNSIHNKLAFTLSGTINLYSANHHHGIVDSKTRLSTGLSKEIEGKCIQLVEDKKEIEQFTIIHRFDNKNRTYILRKNQWQGVCHKPLSNQMIKHCNSL
uniref:Condensin complex subunit 1 n=1 Tax=Rhabditophanes sp. KR3021 TaxID=114890 RepID=A0AC35U3L6_9BILA